MSAFPAGINAAATCVYLVAIDGGGIVFLTNRSFSFDRGLMRARARAIGREYREKGINVYRELVTSAELGPHADSFLIAQVGPSALVLMASRPIQVAECLCFCLASK